jgi:hypothetical protein
LNELRHLCCPIAECEPYVMEELYLEGQHDRSLRSPGSNLQTAGRVLSRNIFWRNKEGEISPQTVPGGAISHEQ